MKDTKEQLYVNKNIRIAADFGEVNTFTLAEAKGDKIYIIDSAQESIICETLWSELNDNVRQLQTAKQENEQMLEALEKMLDNNKKILKMLMGSTLINTNLNRYLIENISLNQKLLGIENTLYQALNQKEER